MNSLMVLFFSTTQETEKWSFKTFIKNIVDFFTSETLAVELIRTLVLSFVLFCIISFAVSGSFLKIVKEEMEKGGEEYGEIAATKVSNRAYLYRVLSVVFAVIIIAGLFAALAFL